MSDKKLKQIKKNWEFRKDVRGHIEGIDVDWLIEQAEKAEQLQKDVDFFLIRQKTNVQITQELASLEDERVMRILTKVRVES